MKTIKLGSRFGKLVVSSDIRERGLVQTTCDCGKQCLSQPYGLRQGTRISCGCSFKETRYRLADESRKTETHPLYKRWAAMRERCNSPKSPAWGRYGGRGIKVCAQWDIADNSGAGFWRFVTDMGPMPPGATIERINNDGPYSPENCRWASRKEQMRNTRSNAVYSYKGFSGCMQDLAAFTGVSNNILRHRIKTLGASVADAVEGEWPSRKRKL